MCTAVILRRPNHPWPVVFGANRDEMQNRPWRAPARHWADRPEVTAGLDELSGGSWLGVNDHGLLAAVLNQPDSLGSAPDKRSRGELVLEALDHAEASHAARALGDILPQAYRGFHVIVADPKNAFWVRHPGEAASNGAKVAVTPIPEGLSMLTAQDLNDTANSPRIARYLPAFQAAMPPDPERGDWTAWEKLLASREPGEGLAAAAGMTFALENGFGTSSSSLIALPSYPATIEETPRLPAFRFAAGPPDCTSFESIPVGR